jgi:pyruvate/2-oxoglutarate dehydrogenase complex dihydrolipoamide acyltransferase (E2) component
MEADAAAPDLPAGPWAGHFANPYAFEVGDLVWIGDDRPVAAAFNIPPRQQVKIVRRARYMGNPIYDLAALDGDIIAEDVQELTLGRTKEDVEAIHPHTAAAAAAIEADAAAADAAAAAAPTAAMEPEAQDPAEDAVPSVAEVAFELGTGDTAAAVQESGYQQLIKDLLQQVQADHDFAYGPETYR